ncbi:hypothetical protein NEMIN01_0501 [Nematocida minor]|uniref:uncharacterized protein n=1 Tax=Nematocida minor TaxID=1912983 RepID=UPI00221E60C0|nr:uncharacterized protein NEMIN01_0501 [Nematocida minor]KAI5189438.1 hypothetical protein NEMIN01_0501 [Nematocida minor]
MDLEFRQFLSEVQQINSQIDSAGKLYTEYITECEMEERRDFACAGSRQKNRNISEEFNGALLAIEKEISKLSEKIKGSESPQKQLHIKSLSDRTKRVLEAFAAEEQAILRKEKERLKEQYLIANPDASNNELDELNDEERAESLIKAAYSLGSKEEKENVEEAEKRSKNVFKILKDIKTLESIGERLQKIIETASEPLCSTAIATYTTNKNTEQTNRIIERIRKQRRRKRTLKIITTSIVFILGIVIIGYIVKILKPFIPKKE